MGQPLWPCPFMIVSLDRDEAAFRSMVGIAFHFQIAEAAELGN
jgi:hypothetical protein